MPRPAAAARYTPPMRPMPSSRARQSTRTTSCWPKPAPASARPSAISRPPGCGRGATTRRSGSRPTPRTCSASSTRKPARMVPDPEERRHRIVIRKGRENYLCLLNMQEAFGRLDGGNRRAAPCSPALIARWALAFSRDGDMVGGDFPVLAPVAVHRCQARRATRDGLRPARSASPTGAANASMPPARITANASSSGRSRAAPQGRHRHRQSCAGAAPGGRRPGAGGRAETTKRRKQHPAACAGSSSMKAIISSMPPTAPFRAI